MSSNARDRRPDQTEEERAWHEAMRAAEARHSGSRPAWDPSASGPSAAPPSPWDLPLEPTWNDGGHLPHPTEELARQAWLPPDAQGWPQDSASAWGPSTQQAQWDLGAPTAPAWNQTAEAWPAAGATTHASAVPEQWHAAQTAQAPDSAVRGRAHSQWDVNPEDAPSAYAAAGYLPAPSAHAPARTPGWTIALVTALVVGGSAGGLRYMEHVETGKVLAAKDRLMTSLEESRDRETLSRSTAEQTIKALTAAYEARIATLESERAHALVVSPSTPSLEPSGITEVTDLSSRLAPSKSSGTAKGATRAVVAQADPTHAPLPKIALKRTVGDDPLAGIAAPPTTGRKTKRPRR